MATVLGLALKISANADGVAAGLSEADKHLSKFAKGLDRIGGDFESLSKSAGGMPAALQATVDEMQQLGDAFRSGAISQNEFAAAFEGLKDKAAGQAAAFKRGAQITEEMVTAEERLARKQKELDDLFTIGAISAQTYERGIEKLKPSTDAAAASVDKMGLEMNELSGLIGLLPGPIGAFASRLSSVFSSGSALQKLFSGGLSKAFATIRTSVAALSNPLTLAAAGFVAAGAAAAALVNSLVSLEDRVEKIGRAARLIGADFNFMQALEVSAKRVGRSFTELQEPLARFAGTVQKAKDGNKELVAAFEGVGISMEELETMSLDDSMRRLYDEFAKIEDPAKKAAAELKFFGEQGPKIRDIFLGFRDADADIKRLGASIAAIQVSNIDALGQRFDEIGVAVQGLGQKLTIPFTGMATAITQGLTTLTAGFGQAAGVILDTLSPAFTAIGVVAQVVFDGIGTLLNGLALLFEPLAGQGRTVSQSFIEIGEAIGSVYDGINSGIQYVRDLLASFTDLSSGVSEASSWIGDRLGRAINILQAALSKVIGYVTETTASFGEWIASLPLVGKVVEGVTATLSGMWEGLKEMISGIGGFIDYVLSAAEALLGIEKVEIKPAVDPESVLDITKEMAAYNDEIAKAQDRTANLGAEGFEAALKYQEKLKEIAELQAEGEYTQEEANRAAAQATKEFDNQTAAIEKRQQAAQKALEADQAIVANLQKQMEIESQFGGDSKRYEAAKNIEAITREIARAEEEIAKARAAGDQEAVNAATKRLAHLDQMAANQEAIASGQVAHQKEMEKWEKKRADKALEYAKVEAERLAGLSGSNTSPLKAIMADSAEGIAEAYRIQQGTDQEAERWEKQYQKLDDIKRAVEKEKPKVMELV